MSPWQYPCELILYIYLYNAQFMYEAFKEQVERAKEMDLTGDDSLSKKAKADRAPLIEVCGILALIDRYNLMLEIK